MYIKYLNISLDIIISRFQSCKAYNVMTKLKFHTQISFDEQLVERKSKLILKI